jgi:hypothetical protein
VSALRSTPPGDLASHPGRATTGES